jgi:hypothetical protein
VRNTGRDQREVVVFGNSALSRARVDPSTQAFDHSALNESLESNTRHVYDHAPLRLSRDHGLTRALALVP